MTTVHDVLSLVETLAPPHYAYSFDKIGLQVGDHQQAVTSVVTTLDCTIGTIEFANSVGAMLIVAHHPVIWEPLRGLRSDYPRAAVPLALLKNGIALVAAHTNWDSAPGGLNDELAAKLGLTNVKPFGSSSDAKAYKLVVFSPENSAQEMVDALSKAGAGRIGLYDQCSFATKGVGSFRGLAGSQPVIGEQGSLTQHPETRLEMVVPEAQLTKVIRTLVEVHPYEEPAYDVVPLQNSNGYPIGRIGELKEALAVSDFVSHVDTALETKAMAWIGKKAEIKRVAVVGGAADEEWNAARVLGADAYLTGEVKHHNAVAGSKAGLLMVQAGHFATEHPGMVAMASRIKQAFPALVVEPFLPDAGHHGRPI